MNDFYTVKQTNASSWARKIGISIALAASLLITQGTAMADNGRGKSKGHGAEYSTISQGHKVPQDRHGAGSHYRHQVASHKGHIKKGGHGKWHSNKGHGKHGYRHHNHRQHNHVYATRILRPDYHVHRHGYHNPRISLGVHLGHFDLYFED